MAGLVPAIPIAMPAIQMIGITGASPVMTMVADPVVVRASL
jgi:hypothetical protein